MTEHRNAHCSGPQPMLRGRFAPSPTGPLHFGSLVAAIASFLDVRSRGGSWLVRMEDLDPPREVPGAADCILRTLEAFALHWDGPVLYQSGRTALYEAALRRLTEDGHAYPCSCSRRAIALAARAGIEGPLYPGTCRIGIPHGRAPRLWRLRVPEAPVGFQDEGLGYRSQDVARAVGDFVLRRADGLFAYQLAVVVDDADQAITHVVRGADLLDSTPRQILLQQLLGLPTPAYRHVPTAVNATGQKLSKQNLARPLDTAAASAAWNAALKFLGQNPPAALAGEPPASIRDWACRRWNPGAIPRLRAAPAPVSAC